MDLFLHFKNKTTATTISATASKAETIINIVFVLSWSLGDTGDDDSPSDIVVVVWVKVVWLLPVYNGDDPDDIVVESVVLFEHESRIVQVVVVELQL